MRRVCHVTRRLGPTFACLVWHVFILASRVKEKKLAVADQNLHYPLPRDPPYPHTASLVGKDDNGQWKSKGSDEYKRALCKAVSLAVLENVKYDDDANTCDPADSPSTEFAAGGGYNRQNLDNDRQNLDDGSDGSNDNGGVEVDETIDDADTPDTAFESLKSTLNPSGEAI